MITINLEAKEVQVIASNYNSVGVQLELKEGEIDKVEIAECISIETFFDAIGEGAIRDFVEKNYDWFNTDS